MQGLGFLALGFLGFRVYSILGLHRDNGKENGSYYSGVIWGSAWIINWIWYDTEV